MDNAPRKKGMKQMLQAINTQDFVTHLQHTLVDRCRKNPQYSLRSFARTLQVSPASISGIMNRRRPLTAKMILRLGQNLGMGPEELNPFLKETAVSKVKNFQALSADDFALISDWHYYAILELMKVNGFSAEAKWIANALGLSLVEIKVAMERLERTKMIEKLPDGSWKDLSGGYSTSLQPGFSNVAAKRYQKQILEKSIQSIESDPLDKRDHTSITMAVSTADIDKAKNLIKKFRRDFSALMENVTDQDQDQVYQLAIGFFPLSKINIDSTGDKK